ncbi:MAG: hypothetical protein AAF772_17660, partial [Acidobacteriota bacterium]
KSKRRLGGLDALAELERIRKSTLKRGGDASRNGRRELDREIRLALEQDHLQRARRVSLTLAIEDDAQRSMLDQTERIELDLQDPDSLRQVLLRLTISLNARA